MTEEDLNSVNIKRSGEISEDKEADIYVALKWVEQRNHLITPFLINQFKSGANYDGYWEYNHMSIQFKDEVNVLTTLHPYIDLKLIWWILRSVQEDNWRPV